MELMKTMEMVHGMRKGCRKTRKKTIKIGKSAETPAEQKLAVYLRQEVLVCQGTCGIDAT
jgi:hypothetical protein